MRGLLADLFRKAEEDTPAVLGGHRGPRARLEGAAGSLGGSVDVFGGSVGSARDHLLGRGVDDVVALPFRGWYPPAVNKKVVSLNVRFDSGSQTLAPISSTHGNRRSLLAAGINEEEKSYQRQEENGADRHLQFKDRD